MGTLALTVVNKTRKGKAISLSDYVGLRHFVLRNPIFYVAGIKMRLSTILIILLLCLFGLLMIISAYNMRERSSFIMKLILMIIGIFCLLVGSYLLVRVVLLG